MFNARRTLCKSLSIRFSSTTSRFIQAESFESFPQDVGSIDLDKPVIFRNLFGDVPAISKWFAPSQTDRDALELNMSHLKPHQFAIVPLELTRHNARVRDGQNEPRFEQFEAPLSLLLTHMSSSDYSLSLYLAQCSLGDLPSDLQDDLPTPNLLNRIGRGDIYASSLWMGRSPTRTPLHRDPNPNLFVQLAGQKILRLFEPEQGRLLYERLRSGRGHANMRGDEMMAGQEMERLEHAVWGEHKEDDNTVYGVEATLNSGTGLFIPKGWWHAVHGVGQGANASVNWWFR